MTNPTNADSATNKGTGTLWATGPPKQVRPSRRNIKNIRKVFIADRVLIFYWQYR